MNRNQINQDFEKLPLKKLFILSVFSSIILIIIGLLCQIILPPQIPLFYGLPQTEKQLVPSIFIVLPSAISLATTLFNAVLAIKVSDNFLKKTLAFTSISISLLVTITTLKIIFLISSL